MCDTDDIEIDVADLTQGNRYTFRVAAVNEMGQSDWLEADGEILAKDPWGMYAVYLLIIPNKQSHVKRLHGIKLFENLS